MKKGAIFGLGFLLAVFLFTGIASAFQFNGTVTNLNGAALNNSVVNFTIYNLSNQFAVIGYESTTTNGSGWFNMTVSDHVANSTLYGLSITHTNETYGHVDYIGQSLPSFPAEVFTNVAASGINFFLRPAGTINITAVNASGANIPFNYQIKDQKLGYAVVDAFGPNDMTSEAIVNLPANRNYSIMVSPNASMPGSADWSNFSATVSYGQGTLEAYNHTTKTLTKIMNMTMGWARIFGYVNLSGEGFSHTGFDEFTIAPYTSEAGNMVHFEFGIMPFNLSAFFEGNSDLYNYATGFYNITLPSTVEDSTMILFAAARNGSNFYGGFHNLSLDYDAYPAGNNTELNFSFMFGLLGDPGNISLDDVIAGGTVNATTELQTFNIVNGSNASITNAFIHAEIDVDYSAYGVQAFTWMIDVDQGADTDFNIPLLNTTGFEEMNLFVSGGGDQQYAPKTVSLTAEEIINNNNISVGFFDPSVIGANSSAIVIGMLAFNSSCDVPDPDSGCFLTSESSNFDPFAAVIGGGALSFSMGTDDVKIIYENVDLLASGPPDALFEDNEGINDSDASGAFEAALQFGSSGPKIFDYALIGISYSETAGSGLNESAQVNISIGTLYDDNGNLIWNTTSNGTSGAALAGNYSHYSARQAEWEVLMNGTICHEDKDNVNLTNPCYIDKTSNDVWIRVPHFSRFDSSIDGSTLGAAAGGDGGGDDGGGGGGGGGTNTGSYWKTTYAEDNNDLKNGGSVTKKLGEKQRVKIKVDKETHYVGVVDLTETTATINVSSDPQQEVFDIGESYKFEVSGDDLYDLIVTLNGISDDRANISVSYIQEEVPPEPEINETATTTGSGGDEGTGSGGSSVFKKLWWLWALIIVVLIILAGLGYYIWSLNEKRERLLGKKVKSERVKKKLKK